MSDVMPCPRQSCATPVLLDLDASMGQCPQCQLAFCIFCKKTYHGVNPCAIKDREFALLGEERTDCDVVFETCIPLF